MFLELGNLELFDCDFKVDVGKIKKKSIYSLGHKIILCLNIIILKFHSANVILSMLK